MAGTGGDGASAQLATLREQLLASQVQLGSAERQLSTKEAEWGAAKRQWDAAKGRAVAQLRTMQAEAARAEFATLLDALRADPFDPAALTAALTAIETRNAERLDLGRSLIETRLIGMSAAERRAFADRLEKGLKRGGKD